MGKAVYGFADIQRILASREADDDSSSVIEQAMIEHFRDINHSARPPWGEKTVATNETPASNPTT